VTCVVDALCATTCVCVCRSYTIVTIVRGKSVCRKILCMTGNPKIHEGKNGIRDVSEVCCEGHKWMKLAKDSV
jgi:hypothetical protein